MSSKLNIFKKLDEKMESLFVSITQNKLSKINGKIELYFSEKYQQIIHVTFGALISILPLFICLIFSISNNSALTKNNNLIVLIEKVKKIESQENAMKSSLRNLIPAREFSSSNNLSKFIYNKVRSAGVSLKDININSAETIETIGDVQVIQIEGKVNRLGTKEVTNILDIIEGARPRAFNEIIITKREKDNLLDLAFSFEARVKK